MPQTAGWDTLWGVKCLRKPPAARAKCLRALPAHRPTRDVESTLGEEGLAARWVLQRPDVAWFNDRGPYGGGTNTATTWVPKVDADDRPFGDRKRAADLLAQVNSGFGGDLLKALTQYPLVATDTGHLLDGWHRLYLWMKSGLPGGPPTLVMVPGRGGLGRISALCPGKEVGPSIYDHSCLVAKPFSLTVEIGPSGNYLRASLRHPQAIHDKQLRQGEVGFVSGVKSGKTLIVGESFLTETFRGKGLGTSLYEALYSRAQQMGVEAVAGTAHSTPASMLHRKMAERHGLEYRPIPAFGPEENWETKAEWLVAPSGAYDEKWRPYSFQLNGADSPATREQVLKQCGCGRVYTKAEWERLPLLGHQLTDDDEGKYDMELRNCSCGSTLGVERKTHDGGGKPLSGSETAVPKNLEAAIKRFQRESGARCTVRGSFKQCAVVAPHLTGRLQHWGFPAKDIELFDLLVPLGPGAHPTWKNEERNGRHDFVHHATLVGDRVIDLTGAQFGAGIAPQIYSLDEARTRWREIVVPERFTGKVLEKLKGLAGLLAPDREAAFARFQDAVRHVWNKPEFVLPVIALSSEEPGNNRNPGGPPVLASITFNPQGVWASGNHLLRRAPSYTVRLADRLFALSPEDQWKILVHEAVHLGYPRHSKEFRDLCREKGGTVSEEALDGQGVKAEKKVGARYQTVRTFQDEKEARRWATEQQRAEPGSRWRLSLGGVGAESVPSPSGWWHGSPSGDLRGGRYGLHIGTWRAAQEALNSRIGTPVEGEWDGTREYGRTLLAGQKTLRARGLYPTGYSASAPEEDHYPTGAAQFGDGAPILPTHRPDLFQVQIVGLMSNTSRNPYGDSRANGMMKAQITRGTAARGYFYTNIGEDSGSVSAVLPGPGHVRRV